MPVQFHCESRVHGSHPQFCKDIEGDIRISWQQLQISLPVLLTVQGTLTLANQLVGCWFLSISEAGLEREAFLLPQAPTYWDGWYALACLAPETYWIRRCL